MMSKVIVSLTSFPAAIPLAVHAVKSILIGSVKPYKVVLYLTASQFPDGNVPPELANLRDNNPLFEFRFYEENIRSYTKLIPALKDFPNDIIVTVDDDISYHKNMLRGLLRTFKKYPEAVIAHRVRRISQTLPYRKWKKYKWYSISMLDTRPRFDNLQTGVGGVLYPPHSLKAEMLDSALFMDIAPTVDDVWFWAAAAANGTKVVPVPFGHYHPRELDKHKNLRLDTINVRSQTDVNLAVLGNVIKKYPILRERILEGGQCS